MKDIPKPDKKTVYAAALIAMKQHAIHKRESSNIVLIQEARKAHKFVAINCKHIAYTIMMMNGEDLNTITAQVTEMEHLISKEMQKCSKA